MAGHLDRGRSGEEAAAHWYTDRGYRVVERNWRCPLGELDLVVARGGVLVFCEVKARRGTAFGGPHESVTWRKQRKLRALAQAYLAASRGAPPEVRFDVASVSLGASPGSSVFVFEGAF